MKSVGFGQLESDKCIFYHIDKDTGKFVLVGCEVDDLIITGNGASCIVRLKKKLQDDCKVKDWEYCICADLSSIDESLEHEVHYDVDDIPVGTRGILRGHLAAACAHELNLTQPEWDTVTTFLTALSQPRRTSKEKSSNLGEARASDHYGHNKDVDETVLDALVTQYMLADSAPEVKLITEHVNTDELSVKGQGRRAESCRLKNCAC